MSDFKSLSKDRQDRLRELEREASAKAKSWIADFPNDWSGKVRFSMALAIAVRIMCDITPCLDEAHFINDVREGAVIWAESGFITGKESEAS